MKILLVLLSAIFLALTRTYASDCSDEPTIQGTGKVIGEVRTNRSSRGSINEAVLQIVAKVPGASWREKGSEAAIVTIFIDGSYNQDVILFAGDKRFQYVSAIGPIDFRKPHTITLVANQKHTAPKVGNIEISASSIRPVSLTDREGRLSKIAIENAPVIYLRPETIGRFSDIPILTYYELLPGNGEVTRIRYTTIFTNEDGGTNSQALLARWGRLTDIEWVYDFSVDTNGRRLSESIQGPNHQTVRFDGMRLGEHPLIFNSTVNNNFTASGCSPLRVSPKLVAAELANRSRETVMDSNPWTYRIMAEEAEREGRIDPNHMGSNVVDDPRNYLYVEIEAELVQSAIAVRISETDGRESSSDWGLGPLRVDRSGYIRIAVRRPAGVRTWPSEIQVMCHGKNGGGECRKLRVAKIVALDEQFRPIEKAVSAAPRTVSAGGIVSFSIAGR
jgi:hypothetical protein